jgi:hypothetical protein
LKKERVTHYILKFEINFNLGKIKKILSFFRWNKKSKMFVLCQSKFESYFMKNSRGKSIGFHAWNLREKNPF